MSPLSARARALDVAARRLRTFGSLIEGSSIVLFLWRNESPDWPVEAVSANVKALLGYTNREFLSGRVSWPGITHADDKPRLEREVQGHLADGRDAWSQQYRLLTKGGRVIWVEDQNRVIRGRGGKITHIQALVQEITARRETEEQLRQRTALLRAYASELTRAEHRERRRIATVLHEDLQQRLVGLQYAIEALTRRPTGRLAAGDAARLRTELEQAIAVLRDLTVRLRPPVLYEFGLRAALVWLARDMKERFDLHVRVTGREPAGLQSPDLRAFAYECVGELLMNVVKHAHTRRAQVRLCQDRRDRFTITVSDEGHGYAPPLPGRQDCFGLFSIRERAEALGGAFSIAGGPGRGTCATLELPCRTEDDERVRDVQGAT